MKKKVDYGMRNRVILNKGLRIDEIRKKVGAIDIQIMEQQLRMKIKRLEISQCQRDIDEFEIDRNKLEIEIYRLNNK